jgi:beta-1,4-mannosyl-glycoprotein beta-1,4-N-acetylglucosaminyltransferase
MAVYECSMFFNENDLLEVKLNEHWEFVDKFIIVEAGETHTGIKKPFYFDQERFKPYAEKLIYITFDSFEEEMAKYPRLDCPVGRSCHGNHIDWARDHFQINYTVKVLEDLGAQWDDIVLYSSLDEIVKPEAFYRTLKLFEDKSQLFNGYSYWNDNRTTPVYTGMRPHVTFNMYLYSYKLNLLRFDVSKGYVSSSMTEFLNYQEILPATLRSMAILTHDHIPDGGWHFTYLDDTDGDLVYKKMQSWAHSKDADPKKRRCDCKDNKEAVEWMLNEYRLEIPRDLVPVKEGTHPSYIINNLDKFEKYILKVEQPNL